MKLRIATYLILLFGLILIGGQSAISEETLSKKLGLRVRTIMIDPWYGGEEKGPRIDKKYGKDITLQLAQKVKDLLEQAEFNVYLTRNGDPFIPLDQRVFLSKSKRADIHLAIKISDAQNDCIRILVASSPVKKIKQDSKALTLGELDGSVDEMLRNLKADSLREESLSLAGTMRTQIQTQSSASCVKLLKGKGYIFMNAASPTVMIDYGISAVAAPSFIKNEDKIARLLSDSIKEYSEQRTVKEEKVN